MYAIKRTQENTVATVSQSDPDQPSHVAGPICEEKKILVFGNEYPLASLRLFPHLKIVRIGASQVHNMGRLMPEAAEVPGEQRRELVINKKFHADFSTI